jgi:hypothetical protein
VSELQCWTMCRIQFFGVYNGSGYLWIWAGGPSGCQMGEGLHFSVDERVMSDILHKYILRSSINRHPKISGKLAHCTPRK